VGHQGLVRVEVTRGTGTEVSVGAHFLRHREIDGATAAMLAGDPAPPPLGCTAPVRPPSPDELLAVLPETARVEHLDAGEITVIFEGVAVSTTPTRLPALHPWVDGVEYDEQAVEVAEPAARAGGGLAEVTVTGFGGQHVGPFETSLALPPGSPTITFDGEDGDLVVRWPAGADDVTVTVEGPTGPICRTIQTAPDAGGRSSLQIPGRLLPAHPPFAVVVERRHRAPLGAPGLTGGELEVVVRDMVTATTP